MSSKAEPIALVVAPAVPRRTIRTRSSTGGSAAKLDDDDDEDALRAIQDDSSNQGDVAREEDEEEMDENAMVLDEPVQRPIKAIRLSARASLAATTGVGSTSAAIKVKADAKPSATTKPAAIRARVPLAAKTTNRRAVALTATVANRLAHVKRAKEIIAEVERAEKAKEAALIARRIAIATEELDAAIEAGKLHDKELEEHAAKRARTTSEVEIDEEADSDEEAIEEMESKIRRKDVHVNGRGMKDEGWVDLDYGDEEDPLMVSSYVVEVYEYMRELEVSLSFAPLRSDS